MPDRPKGRAPKSAAKKGPIPRRGAAQSPATPKRTYNADRTAALRKNRQDAIAHAKDMAKRMGVQPVDKKALPEDGERLHVRIAHSGICSRRAAEKLILEGRVEVNGQMVAEMGIKVGEGDEVRVDGQVIFTAKIYTVVVNKPLGVVTTLFDPQRRPTIQKYLPDYGVQLKPVGRLDIETEGLLVCTNDGELALRLAHPRYGVEKEYQAIVTGIPDEKALQKLRDGVFFDGRKSLPAKVDIIHAEPKSNSTGLRITLHEGRKRQVRLMCELVGHPVTSLKRIRYGSLYLKGMRSGECRLLGKKEVDELKRMVGLPVN
jgi:23S rRNA pseudouridine2605 synthase